MLAIEVSQPLEGLVGRSIVDDDQLDIESGDGRRDLGHQQIDIVQRELFGPVVSALRFTDEAHALQLANDSRFGLAAGIFTADIGRALRITKGIRSGIVWVNTYRMVSPLAPFGGYKDSGYGRESGLEAIYDYTRSKTVWLNTSPDPIADPFVMQ